MTSKLKLGPLPNSEFVKVTITMSSDLKSKLDRYAEAHAKTWGAPVDAARLIPFMLEDFIRKDRGFRRLREGAT